MDRIATIRSMFAIAGRGLEIGPSYNPIFPKAEGFAVETVDHATADELRAKYAHEPNIDCSCIEDVDHVWDGRPLTELLDRREFYDYVVASHVIEHIPDPLGFLKECSSLLRPEGVLFLAVPDKRRCFDILRPPSTTGGILQAHAERRERHCPATAFDHVAYMANLNGAAAWTEHTTGNLSFTHNLPFACSLFDRALTAKEYHDFHAWMFCPSSFRLIIKELNDLEVFDLRESKFIITPSIEFFVTLSRSGEGCNLSRLSLLQMAQEELREFPIITSTSEPELSKNQALWAIIQANRMEAAKSHRLLEAAEAQIKAAELAAASAEARIVALKRSMSWRVTSPLRFMARSLRE